MTRLEQIEKEIEALPAEDFTKLMQWIMSKDRDDWDRQIEADSKQGKFDRVLDRIKEAKTQNALGDLHAPDIA